MPVGLSLVGGLISGLPARDDNNTFEVLVHIVPGGPARPADYPHQPVAVVDEPVLVAGNQFRFRRHRSHRQIYTAQFSFDLTNWTELYTTNAPDTLFFIADTNTAGSRFYRLKVNN